MIEATLSIRAWQEDDGTAYAVALCEDAQPQAALADNVRDAVVAATRKAWEARDAAALLADEAAAVVAVEDRQPAAPAVAFNPEGIRAILEAGGRVAIDYTNGAGSKSYDRVIEPGKIEDRIPAGGFTPEPFVTALDVESGEPREFYLSRISRAERRAV